MYKNKEEFYSWLQNKRVAFIGAGRSHKQLIETFTNKGAIITLCDKKNIEDFGEYKEKLNSLNVFLSLGEHYLDGLKEQDLIMRTPGFDYKNPALQDEVAKGVEVSSEIELFLQLCPCKKYAITGSDGKTTTTSLIAEMLTQEGRVVHKGGNIGIPLLPIIDKIKVEDVAVVELSSFQLMNLKQSVDVAVVTNVTPNHLDYHKDMQEYIDCKRNILLNQKSDSKAVLGYENEISKNMDKDVKGEYTYFSRLTNLGKGGYIDDDGYLTVGNQRIIHKDLVGLRGLHNLENILAACCAVKDDVSVEVMYKVAKEFKGVEHRIEPVRELNGVSWYNDSIASSPTRTIAGLNSFDQKICIIAGGYDKKISFLPLAPVINKNVKLLVLMGQTANDIEKCVRADSSFDENNIEIVHADSMKNAVEIMYNKTRQGDIVSLSPACASFDMYVDFEARGRDFKDLVNSL